MTAYANLGLSLPVMPSALVPMGTMFLTSGAIWVSTGTPSAVEQEAVRIVRNGLRDVCEWLGIDPDPTFPPAWQRITAAPR